MGEPLHSDYVNEGLYGSILSTTSMGQVGIEHLKKVAREQSWVMRAEVYDDLIGNTEELKKAIMQVEKKDSQLVQKCREYALKRYSPEVYYQKMKSIYDSFV